MELVREVLWSWNESILNFWSSLVANRVFLNTLQLVAIAGVYVWAKQRGTNVAVIVVGVTAFYVYRYLDGECQRVSAGRNADSLLTQILIIFAILYCCCRNWTLNASPIWRLERMAPAIRV